MALNLYGYEAWHPPSGGLNRRLARGVDAAVAITDVTRQRFLGWSGVPAARSHVLPCAVDLSSYGPGPAPTELAQRHGLAGRRVLMTLARLSADERYKGIDEVLEALPDLAREIPNVSYLICGDGSDRSRLEAKAVQLGLRDRVVFAGRIAEEAKRITTGSRTRSSCRAGAKASASSISKPSRAASPCWRAPWTVAVKPCATARSENW